MMLDPLSDELEEWYRHLYGDVEEGWLSFFAVDRTTGTNKTEWCKATDIAGAVAITRRLNEAGDVWNGVAVRTHRTSGRGGARECGWITALWADIDFQDAGHQNNDRLPPDVDAATEIVKAFPIKPTALTHTGGGLQVWHMLDEVAAVDEVGDLLEAYGATWNQVAADLGYHIDNVFDLARIMRPVGSYNRKLPQARPVTLTGARWERRYGVSEIRDACIDPPTPVYGHQRSEVPYIGPDRPGDDFTARHDGHELITRAGFHSPQQDRSGDVHYRAPHRGPKDTSGATVYADGHITIYSETFASQHPGIEVRRPYDPFGFYVALEYGGDFTSATAELRRKGYGDPRADPFGRDRQPPPHVDPETGEVVRTDPRDPRLVAVYWADDETDPPEPIDELVTNLVARGELTVLGAPRAMGKTWATMQLAAMCSEGEGLMFGSDLLATTQPATVVYLQGELGRAGSYGRWRLATNGKPPHVAEVFDRLKIRVTSTKTSSTHDGITTTDEIARAIVDHRLEPLLEELDADLLIVDPWATYFAGQENSNDETEAAIDALTQMLRRIDCAGWIVHHISAKATHGTLAEPEDLWRGASRLADAVATRVTLLPHYTPAKARELGLDRFQARRYGDLHILQRNGPPVPVIHTQLERFQWAAWSPPNTDGGRPPVLSDRDVVDALRAGPITSKRHLAKVLGGVSHSTLDQHIERLSELGVLAVDEGANRSKVYSLIDEGGLP